MYDTNEWYKVGNIEDIDTPALLVYPDRIINNIKAMIKIAGGTDRLRPHVKTYKMTEVVRLQKLAGIQKFKCATIAEAEMLAIAGAQDVLLAHQPVGPRISRLFELTRFYPKTKFSAIVDCKEVIDSISQVFSQGRTAMDVYIDIDSGNHRTGVDPSHADDIFKYAWDSEAVRTIGIHVYDGHIRQMDFSERKKQCDNEFRKVEDLVERLHDTLSVNPQVIAGGTPTFPIHAQRKNVECSPGTTLFWDWGYHQSFKDLPFEFAAVLASRIISRPGNDLLCLDLGHKAVAAENPLDNRVSFLNIPGAEVMGHSEEHLVVKVKNNRDFFIGQVAYGIPYHICPTTALYDRVFVIEENRFTHNWRVIARDRIIKH